ncbi:MAG: hypothetical protein WD872_14855 [Pirellulaceae bacterium]
MLRRTEVQDDLEFAPFQQDEIAIIADERNKFMGGFMEDLRRMTDDERQAAVATIKERDWTYEARAEDVLLPHQRRRLGQIRLQDQVDAKAPSAGLSHPHMIVKLEITDTQRKRINATAQMTDATLQEKIEKLQKEIKQARDEARRKVLAELTDEQRRQYQEMVGDLVDFVIVPRAPQR